MSPLALAARPPRLTEQAAEFDAADVEARARLMAAIMALPWISPDQASVVLQVSPSTIKRAIVLKQLRAVRVGSKLWRLRPEWLSAYAERA